MNIVLDACAIINLINGTVFNKVLLLKGDQFCVGPQASEECGEAVGLALEQAISSGKVALLNDNEVTAAAFITLLQEHGLGDGETESLTFAQSLRCVICTDDKRARTVSKMVLGEARVTGSLGLLKKAVVEQIMSATEAFAAYEKMKSAGGFLPDIDLSFFIMKHKGTA